MTHRQSRTALTTAIVAATLALASCAPAGPPPPERLSARAAGQCFLSSQVRRFTVVDRETLMLRSPGGRSYALQTLGPCNGLQWARGISIRSRSGGSFLCPGDQADIYFPGPLGVERCLVTGLRLLSPAEVRAMNARRPR
jgi:hypothetical protein